MRATISIEALPSLASPEDLVNLLQRDGVRSPFPHSIPLKMRGKLKLKCMHMGLKSSPFHIIEIKPIENVMRDPERRLRAVLP
jgi:hypothetical protein